MTIGQNNSAQVELPHQDHFPANVRSLLEEVSCLHEPESSQVGNSGVVIKLLTLCSKQIPEQCSKRLEKLVNSFKTHHGTVDFDHKCVISNVGD